MFIDKVNSWSSFRKYPNSNKIRTVILFLLLFTYSLQAANNYATTDNVTASWTTSSNWLSTGGYSGYPGLAPNGNAGDYFYINGAISVGSSSSTTNLDIQKGTLVVNDTLFIYGNLTLGNNANLTISDGAILIVYGNVAMSNQVNISSNSYFVIGGSFTKSGSAGQGAFTSNDSPSNVFIGGTISVPSGFADTGNGVFNCSATSEWSNTSCNYGNFVDIQNSPINTLVSGNCAPVPYWNTNGQPSASPNPVSSGSSFTLSANVVPDASWTTSISQYIWNGPSSYSYSSTSSASVTRSSASSSMEGYYSLTAINSKGCSVKDSVYVSVGSCYPSAQIFSRNNYTGNWETSTSWSKSDPSFTIPPSATPVPSQTIGINGYITRNGDLTVTGSNQTICDTLVITGNLYLTSNQFTVSSTGLLIVLGNFSSGSGQLINNSGGRIVFVDTFNRSGSYTFNNSGSIYVFDNNPVLNGFTPTGDESTLQTNDPTLFTFVNNIICGGGISGGTIASDQSICSGSDVAAFTNSSGASPGSGFTYQWYSSTNSSNPLSGTWNLISGATSITYDNGNLTQTTYFYRMAQLGAGCTANSNVITVTVNSTPTANAGGTLNACGTASVSVSGASATNYTSLAWAIISGSGSLTNQTTIAPTYTPVVADEGTTVVLRLSSITTGCTTATSDKNIDINQVPSTGTIIHD